MIGRVVGSAGRAVFEAAMAARRAGIAVTNDRGLQHMGRLGAFEVGESLRAFPDANIPKVNLGLLTADAAGARAMQRQAGMDSARQAQVRTPRRDMERG